MRPGSPSWLQFPRPYPNPTFVLLPILLLPYPQSYFCPTANPTFALPSILLSPLPLWPYRQSYFCPTANPTIILLADQQATIAPWGGPVGPGPGYHGRGYQGRPRAGTAARPC